MKTYAIKTRFSFAGTFFIKADCEDEAEGRVVNDCGLVMGRGIHTSLSEDLADWKGWRSHDL
jgi:hypothetical protein